MKFKARIMDENYVKRSLTRISYEIIENTKDLSNVVLLGIYTRGVPLAEIIADKIEAHAEKVAVGKLDITFYRDDIFHVSDAPILNGTDVDVPIDGKDVIIVDDVLYTGRTARAAMEAVFSLGRPRSIRLAILVDRGHRELPIRADFVGKNVPTSSREVIAVHLDAVDGKTDVELYETE